jgi:hypothetical protein
MRQSSEGLLVVLGVGDPLAAKRGGGSLNQAPAEEEQIWKMLHEAMALI